MSDAVMTALLSLGLGLPLALLAVLGVSALGPWSCGERTIRHLMQVSLSGSLLSLLAAWLVHAARGGVVSDLPIARLLGDADSGLELAVLADWTTLSYAVLATAACGVVSAFSSRYLHGEPGYQRYFLLFAAFVVGVQWVALAGSIEMLICGWELLGISSALLVAFFHERSGPVRSALHVFTIYRIGDAALLTAAVLVHHALGSGRLAVLFGQAAAPSGLTMSAGLSSVVALLLLIAVVAKSALLPVSGWLPRAMDGPTTSSAIYYGALSTHAGCLLLIRAAPVFERAPAVRVLAVVLGLSTAIHAARRARVQVNVKCKLAYSSLAQVGLIVIEAALGLHALALLHVAGNVSLRLLQFLNSPNVLHDLHRLEGTAGPRPAPAGGRHGDMGGGSSDQAATRERPDRSYVLALEGGFLDQRLHRLFVAPLGRLLRTLDRLDRWMSLSAPRAPASPGGSSRG